MEKEKKRKRLDVCPFESISLDVLREIAHYLSPKDRWTLLFVMRCAHREPSRQYEVLRDVFVYRFPLNVPMRVLHDPSWAPNELTRYARMVYCNLKTTEELRVLATHFKHATSWYLRNFRGKLSKGIFSRKITGSLDVRAYTGELPIGLFAREIFGCIDLERFNGTLRKGALPQVVRGGYVDLRNYTGEISAGILPRHVEGCFYLNQFNGEISAGTLSQVNCLFIHNFKGFFPPSNIKCVEIYRDTIELTDEMRRDGFHLPLE